MYMYLSLCGWLVISVVAKKASLARLQMSATHDIHTLESFERTLAACNFDNAFLLFYCGFLSLSFPSLICNFFLLLHFGEEERIKITNNCRVKLSSNNIKNNEKNYCIFNDIFYWFMMMHTLGIACNLFDLLNCY